MLMGAHKHWSKQTYISLKNYISECYLCLTFHLLLWLPMLLGHTNNVIEANYELSQCESNCMISIALFPGHLQILSHSCVQIFLYSCEIKSGAIMGEEADPVHCVMMQPFSLQCWTTSWRTTGASCSWSRNLIPAKSWLYWNNSI